MKIRSYAVAAFLATVFFPLSASAACTWCWGGQCWFIWDASCNQVANTLEGGICFTAGSLMVNPSTDYIERVGGSAFLVQRAKRTPFASDGMGASLNALNAKFPLARRRDPMIREEVRRAQELLFRETASGAVSPTAVNGGARALGLAVRGK
ncbi:MAG: hypothetical protein Q8L23_15585 [Caulobacter sp.]|nr:hypothetical protein [Caulobacter sp.]